MSYDLTHSLVVGIASRALFDLEDENLIYEQQGLQAYSRYQVEHEDDVLRPGTAFHLVKALLRLNTLASEDHRLVEVIVMSRNSPDTGLRILNSTKHYGLDITRAAFAGGESLAPYLKAFSVDLFLSRSEADVQEAADAGHAAALICNPPEAFDPAAGQIRIAFDCDAVIFSDESERVYQEQGLEAFQEHEQAKARSPLPEGPFARLLKTISVIQTELATDPPPVRVALITARNCPAHERVIRTLRAWNVRVDEAFFLGGVAKDEVLRAYRAHIFFDDQDVHLGPASRLVPSARVPRKKNDPESN